MNAVLNHLLQSTLFAGLAALLAFLFRKNFARIRYWLWVAASLKFLVPFSLLLALGSHLGWIPLRRVIHTMTVTVTETAPQTNPIVLNLGAPAESVHPTDWSLLLPALWACGFIAVLFHWWRRWRTIHTAVRQSSSLTAGREFETLVRLGAGRIRLRSSTAALEPGIFGIVRPTLLLPDGIAAHLDEAQLRAVMAHEVCHARRRDNLFACIHMVVEALLWFHPLVWWLGARLVEERERACDEEVLNLCREPQAYAEGILKVCRFYLESPLACVAGITGANLKHRIERIVTMRTGKRPGLGGRLLLAGAGLLSLLTPITIGLLTAPVSRGQAKSAYEVVSIHQNKSGTRGGQFNTEASGLTVTNMPLQTIIKVAYGLQDYQIAAGPAWLETDRYDIAAKGPGPLRDDDQPRMMQALLADRFKLAVHRESKEMQGYALVVTRSGFKLSASKADGDNWARTGRGSLTCQGVSMSRLASILAGRLGRPIVDATHIDGAFDFKLEWTPDPGQPLGPKERAEPLPADDNSSGPSIYTALQEQLGLKLEARKASIEVVVIDHIERPSEN